MFAVSALLLICPIAVAEPPTAVLTPNPALDPTAALNPSVSLNPAAGLEITAPDEISEVVVQAPEPRFAAPTLRDRIGRIWAPVLINGRGPYRLVLDTGATHSAIIAQTASSLGIPLSQSSNMRVTGVTGSAVVPTIAVKRMEFGELSMAGSTLPIVADVFGGAEGILGTEGLSDKRIVIDFGHDEVVIMRSKGELGKTGLTTLPLRQLRDHLLALDVLVGGVRVKAIIDTGAQISIGNNALRTALMASQGEGFAQSGDRGSHVGRGGGRHDAGTAHLCRDVAIELREYNLRRHVHFRPLEAHSRTGAGTGMDVLGTVDTLVIDYRLRQLQMRLRRS